MIRPIRRARRLAGLVGALACVVGASSVAAQAPPAPSFDAQSRAAFTRQYDQLSGVKPGMIVEELRLRVELVASRGSQIGAASNDKRLRGFESLLLQHLQSALCRGGSPPAAKPSPAVVDGVIDAARAQRLRTEDADVAELSAIVQRLVDSQSTTRLCAVASLDEVR
jgi:hypothetical protein